MCIVAGGLLWFSLLLLDAVLVWCNSSMKSRLLLSLAMAVSFGSLVVFLYA